MLVKPMTPQVSIFIRSCSKDAPFLHELFRSIDKRVSGFREIVVNCTPADRHVIEGVVRGRAKIKTFEPWTSNGYCDQQISKIFADILCEAPYILYWDSDYLITHECTPESFFVDNRPHLLITPFDALGSSVPWRAPTERIMGERVEFESMRGPRICHSREVLIHLRDHISRIHNTNDVGRWLAGQPDMSEFNCIGHYAITRAADRYTIHRTDQHPLPFNPVRQFFSGNGITPNIRREMDMLLA